MFEKALNARKNFILLRLRFVPIALCVALLLCSFALPVSADVLNYEDYVVNVEVDGANDLVTLRFPTDGYFFWVTGEQYGYVNKYDPVFYANLVPGTIYSLNFFPFYRDRLGLTNIPNGTTFNCSFELHKNTSDWDSVNMDSVLTDKFLAVKYYDIAGEMISNRNFGVESSYEDGIFNFSSTIDYPSGTNDGAFYFVFRGFSVDEPLTMGFSVLDFSMTMSISALYRDQEGSGTTNRLLDVVRKELEANGQTLEEVLAQQGITNDKLDDVNQNLETLPGEIGNEIQGVIDKEKEESKGEGNKFVDQILDALPDPSTDVLAALKGLTDATAYTGTDAVLPIPAIVLPGIDGLFPETEIWGGAEFDFGEYIGVLPSALLTLVQSLFTIAIVLFCVYELKGIISFVFTLNELHRGDWE